MSERELRSEDVNAVLEEESILSAYATELGIELCLSNGQRITAIGAVDGRGLLFFLDVDSDEEDQEQAVTAIPDQVARMKGCDQSG